MKKVIKITESNESEIIKALREYYRDAFKNGDSDDAFIMWIQSITCPDKE